MLTVSLQFLKHFLILLIAALHFTATSGATVRLHYCMGHFVEAHLLGHSEDNESEDHSCPKCGMEVNDDSGCCKDKDNFVKDNSQKAVKQPLVLQFSDVVATAPLFTFYLKNNSKTYPTAIAKSNCRIGSPPLLGHPLPLYLSVSSIRV